MPQRPRVPSDQETLRALELRRANVVWLERHRDELLDAYAGKFIAVLDERVVAEDADFVRLLARLGNEHPTVDPSVPVIRFLSEPPPARRTRE